MSQRVCKPFNNRLPAARRDQGSVRVVCHEVSPAQTAIVVSVPCDTNKFGAAFATRIWGRDSMSEVAKPTIVIPDDIGRASGPDERCRGFEKRTLG
jgi:hypothetical protein